MTNDQDKAIRNFRKLNSFFENKLDVFFRLDKGQDAGNWRKGEILDLNLEKLTLVLQEDLLGARPFLLEEIKEDSITGKKEEK